ncbi:MAG: peptide chain release factor N(5)-glutamine methyltransferase [Gemmatimonadaceae bacterium]|nr:peptide chain release factor N(5)-glutamine methyltransferase [Gloeobacterales cyanobacterium ES-bin-141]
MTPVPVWPWRQAALVQARQAGLDPLEVDYLIESVTGMDRLQLRLTDIAALEPWQAELDRLWERRLGEHVPLQYLVGEVHWHNLRLSVGPGALIPRPETELLVDLVVQFCRTRPSGLIADLGTGTGAIALALALALPKSAIIGIELSGEALAIARQNRARLGLEQVQLLQGSWFEPLEPWRGRLDVLVSNPPYIPSSLVVGLAPEVRLHEPHLALDGGEDGLEHIRHLVEGGPDYLRSGGLWVVEVMSGQAVEVEALLQKNGHYKSIQVFKDLEGVERFVSANAWDPGS